MRSWLVSLFLMGCLGSAGAVATCPPGTSAIYLFSYNDADMAQLKGFLGFSQAWGGFPAAIQYLGRAMSVKWQKPCSNLVIQDATQWRRLTPDDIKRLGGLPANHDYANIVFKTKDGGSAALDEPGHRFLAFWKVLADGKNELIFNRDVEFDMASLYFVFEEIKRQGGLVGKSVVIMQPIPVAPPPAVVVLPAEPSEVPTVPEKTSEAKVVLPAPVEPPKSGFDDL